MQTLEWTKELIAIASVAGLILVVLGFFLSMVFQGRKAAELNTQLQWVEQDREHKISQNQKHQEEIMLLNQALHQKELSESQLKFQLDSIRDQFENYKDDRVSLKQEFENLANKIFEEKNKTFTDHSEASINHLLKPFKEQVEGFQNRINEVHATYIQGNAKLNAEIDRVLKVGLEMNREANNLTTALKGDSKKLGAWGEAQLRRTLEISGLVEGTHFEMQSSFRDDKGKTKLIDCLIKLPDGKHIIIDSKVTLNAYMRVIDTELPEAYKLAVDEHIKAVRSHINDLASKDYTNLIGMRSPNIVLMFMPNEPAYIEALKNSKDLFEYGYKQGIVLVSHTTMIPILRTVSNLWMIERSNSEAREISEKAGDIYNQVRILAERLSKLGGTLTTASKHYNDTVTALAGHVGLYGKVDRFRQVSDKIVKPLPPMEAVHMDFEAEKLALIVEPNEQLGKESDEKPDSIKMQAWEGAAS